MRGRHAVGRRTRRRLCLHEVSMVEPQLRLRKLHGGALALRGRLADRRVCGLGDLAAVWAAEPRWLLAELTRLLPPPRRAALAEAWPRLLPAAQKALRKRT